MSLAATIDRTLGTFRLRAEIHADVGETVAVLGPNGSGKTTLFRCLAGLVPIDRGRITLHGTVLDDPAADLFVRPEQRPVAVVFQDYLLFAHLSALDNVAFGLRSRRIPKADARRRAIGWLERVGLADHAHHRPQALSGGQAQRVALARALATEPGLLLLDEPLAALDVSTRRTVRRELRRHLQTFAGVRLLVTHDPLDAYALADRLVILEHGEVTQTGTIATVTAHPRSRYVADLVGINLFAGRGSQRSVTIPTGARIVTTDEVDGETFAAIHPRSVAIYRTPPDGSPRNVWNVTVADIDRQLDRVRISTSGEIALVAEITVGALDELELRPGDTVWAVVKATDITTYPI
jgi:molybdate transport system ATP-binding protein